MYHSQAKVVLCVDLNNDKHCDHVNFLLYDKIDIGYRARMCS